MCSNCIEKNELKRGELSLLFIYLSCICRILFVYEKKICRNLKFYVFFFVTVTFLAVKILDTLNVCYFTVAQIS